MRPSGFCPSALRVREIRDEVRHRVEALLDAEGWR
jgi:hypothetical protein